MALLRAGPTRIAKRRFSSAGCLPFESDPYPDNIPASGIRRLSLLDPIDLLNVSDGHPLVCSDNEEERGEESTRNWFACPDQFDWLNNQNQLLSPVASLLHNRRFSQSNSTSSLNKQNDKIHKEKRHFRRSSVWFLDNKSDVVDLKTSKASLLSPSLESSEPSAPKRRSISWGLSDGLIESIQNGMAPDQCSIASTADEQDRTPQLVKSEWEDLNLWSEEVEAWSVKHKHMKVSSQEKKKQDIIYELYITEKHHCQVIVILQQAYQQRLREERMISTAELNQLIPDVVDGLLTFHLNLFRQIRNRVQESILVDTLSDIILKEFGPGPLQQTAVEAYTHFCSMKDEAGRVFTELKASNSRFRHFFERYENDPVYKERSFKSCLLLITQRLTKYPLLADQLLKFESLKRRDMASTAAVFVRRFAATVDSGLEEIELRKQWNVIQRALDRTSATLFAGKRFTYDDLVAFDNERQIMGIGQVLWQNAIQKPEQVLMVLFDDIIIFLSNKSGKYQFFSQDNHEAVISLKSLLIREKVRSSSVLFIVAPPAEPDMYEIMFITKQEMKQWQTSLANAHANAKPVRRICEEMTYSERRDNLAVDEEKKHLGEMIKWTDELRALFSSRSFEEARLKEYMIRRMDWFDQVRRHLQAIPCKSRSDIPEKVKSLLRDKFRELRDVRQASLAECAERVEKVRDLDLISFYDDAYDINLEWSGSDGSDGDDKDQGRLPRRIRTFHGVDHHRPEMGIRRHTTLPKMTSLPDEQRNEFLQFRSLPLGLSGRAHRAATKLVLENMDLRADNNRLRNDLALVEMRLAVFTVRKPPSNTTSTDALEALRKKQVQLQNDKRQFQQAREESLEVLVKKREELERKDKQIQEENDYLQRKWEAFYRRTGVNRKFDWTPDTDLSTSDADSPMTIDGDVAELTINSDQKPDSFPNPIRPYSSVRRSGRKSSTVSLSAKANKSKSSSDLPRHLINSTKSDNKKKKK